MLSETLQYEKKFADIDGQRIAYIDVVEGAPIVLLHGNPTASLSGKIRHRK